MKTVGQLVRIRMDIRGRVQGVGFRPFVFRLAREMGLSGWVSNSLEGVSVEAEGSPDVVNLFAQRLIREKPHLSSFEILESRTLEAVGRRTFEIRESQTAGTPTALVLPDTATCADCLRELFDVSDRRYLYPFVNCTNCGPRYSIIESLPYDRQNTTMKRFQMCRACTSEYNDPSNRRFHAEPNACPACGPSLRAWDTQGHVVSVREDALRSAVRALRQGATVAIKGLGGFQLLVAAKDDAAVRRLRLRKQREEKPFAVMYPSLDSVAKACEVNECENAILTSPAAPIVLLRRHSDDLAPSVAPGNSYLGVMLPYTPLHHILMSDLDFPIVATSGNRSDEPICIDEREALERLGRVADLLLVHNRPIARHVDDSVTRVILGDIQVLRRARGYSPLPIDAGRPLCSTLAVGGHLKNTVAVAVRNEVIMSQHIGDLESAASFDAFRRVVNDLTGFYKVAPASIVADAHPDYISTRFAARSDAPHFSVQHHYAHVLSCMADNKIEGPVLGVAWDGSGFGLDGTIWGGEFLRVDDAGWRRVAHFRKFPIPGGDAAIREPRRAACGVLYELFGDVGLGMGELPPVQAFTPQEGRVLQGMLKQQLNTPRTSSVGRLFDAVASFIGLRHRSNFEGQAAMDLEFAADRVHTMDTYGFRLSGDSGLSRPFIVDWDQLFRGILDDIRRHERVEEIAAKFHNALVEIIVDVARRIGEKQVVLTGGCFQNRYLTEHAAPRLLAEGFRPYWHHHVPPNDGGIAVGQVLAAALEQEKPCA